MNVFVIELLSSFTIYSREKISYLLILRILLFFKSLLQRKINTNIPLKGFIHTNL